MMMFTEGQIIKGQYRILNEIAQGELGPVYRAIDLNSRSACVLKPLCLNGAAEIEPLKQELEKIQALRHSNIASVGEVEETEDHQFFIHREYLDGVTLEEVIWKQAPLPLSRACTIAKQIARALEAAHHAGIIHGNLTPSKVLLVSEEGEERIKVLGFGTLTLKKDRFIDLARLPMRNGGAPVFGDQEYISPQQAVAMEAGLGGVFSEPRARSDRPDLVMPEVIDTLVGRMPAKARHDRPASAAAV